MQTIGLNIHASITCTHVPMLCRPSPAGAGSAPSLPTADIARTKHELEQSWNTEVAALRAQEHSRLQSIERERSGGRVPAILDMVKSDSVKAQLEHKRFEAQHLKSQLDLATRFSKQRRDHAQAQERRAAGQALDDAAVDAAAAAAAHDGAAVEQVDLASSSAEEEEAGSDAEMDHGEADADEGGAIELLSSSDDEAAAGADSDVDDDADEATESSDEDEGFELESDDRCALASSLVLHTVCMSGSNGWSSSRSHGWAAVSVSVLADCTRLRQFAVSRSTANLIWHAGGSRMRNEASTKAS